MEDGEIIRLYWAREEQAIRASSDKYGRYCQSISQTLLGNAEDAEECVSDTWLCVWNSIPPTRPAVLRLFFAKIVRGLSLDSFRHRTAQKRGGGTLPVVLDELADCLAAERGPADEVEYRMLTESIRAFVEGLPERERNLFLRRYFFGQTVEQISKDYGISANHAAAILCRTRKKLRLRLTKEGYFDE